MQQDKVVQESRWFRSVLLLAGMNNLRFQPILLAALVCWAVPVLILAGKRRLCRSWNTHSRGMARDIAWPLRNRTSSAVSYRKDCITKCAEAGSPLGILTNGGSVYVPVSESMPDTGQDAPKPLLGAHHAGNGQSVRKERYACHRYQRNT
jgi:hypothetical protein